MIGNNVDTATLEGLGLTRPATEGVRAPTTGSLQQEAFLELMIAQFQNQDPFKPMENGDFLGQLAQFGTVSGIEELRHSFTSFANSLYSDQALQASNLIGQDVLVTSRFAGLGQDGEIRGAVELRSSTPSLTVRVTDANGALVRNLELGTRPAGTVGFAWDGRNESGVRMPPGSYRIDVVSGAGGQSEQLPVMIADRVDSVTLGGGSGVQLNLKDMGEVELADVRRIGAF